MSFVWNNVDCKLVGDEEFKKLSKNHGRYVVARRLFVSSDTPLSDVSKITR